MSQRNIKKIFKIFTLTLLMISAPAVIIGGAVVTCSYAGSIVANKYKEINLGDSRDSVIDVMGEPSYVEERGNTFSRYADRPCEGNCYERIWYELSWCMGLQSWAIVLDRNGKVIHKIEFFSP